jgi:plastocyanin domain-containing protein
MNSTTASIFIGIMILTGAFFIATSGNGNSSTGGPGAPSAAAENVTITDNVQTIEIRAKGGYWPRKSVAKAGIPTVIKVNTAGTYDCSAAIRIPSLSIAKMLPPNGTSEIALGTPEAGKLRGTCGMGMYNFEIQFQ